MATNPLIDAYKNLQRLPVPNTAVAAMPAAPPPPPALPASPSPIVTTDPVAQNMRASLLGHQQELQRLNDTGSGISQIKNPFLRGLARVGDVAETILAPRAAAFTPGTEMNHQRLVGQEYGHIGQDLGQQYQQAKIGEENALADYTQQRPEIEQSKIDQRQTAVQERVAQAAAAHGQKVSWDANGLPSFADDYESQAFHDRQALSAMHEATAEKSKVMAEINKNHYVPGTPEWVEAQHKIVQADEKIKATLMGLGLRAQSVQLRRNDQNANFYGVGPDGHPLPNAPQFQDDEGNVTTGGLKGAKTAITQQGKVGQFRDLEGSVTHAQSALEALHNSGSALSDAKMVAAMSDPHSTVGQYINGQLVRGNLNDQQIQALGALNQLREQIGILRATTGGTAAEAQAQRMLDTLPTAGDSPAIVRNKLKEINGVLSRLTPSVPTTSGGLSIGGKGGHSSSSPKIKKFNPTTGRLE